jgi:putative tricarboxylic transport membrane protein
MTLRTDHVAGASFVAFGVMVLALSGDLPFGRLSMPGAGFMPKLVAGLLIVFGLTLALRAADSRPFADLDRSDLPHAACVVLITGMATAVYIWLGFIATMTLLLFGLLVVIERRPVAPAALYSLSAALLAYGLFGKLLKAPLPSGPFGF